MRRPVNTEQDTPGYDSFLDIVANLIGILVILIMVLGVRAQKACRNSAQAAETSSLDERDATDILSESAIPDLDSSPVPIATTALPPIALAPPLELPDVEVPQRQVAQMRQSAHEIDGQIANIDLQSTLQRSQRDKLLVSLTLRERELAEKQQRMAAAEQAHNLAEQQLLSAREELLNLQQQVDSVDDSVPEPIVLPHRPAPLAQTVFGREEHFRLHSGRLSYVPMKELVQQLKNEAKNKSWKLENAPAITETIGPINDYYLRYKLRKVERTMRTESGPVRRTMVELDNFVLLPITEMLGSPTERALTEGSDFLTRLSQFDSNEVTITVWTYPDSYAELRQLKEFLWQRGFLAAARPLPAGFPISGSPSGTRSAAE